MKHKYILFKLLFAMALLIVSKLSLAITCSYGDWGQNQPTTPYFNFGTVVVQRDTPVGTVLKSATLNYASSGTILGCTTAWTEVGQMTLFTTNAGINNVFNTNLSGIGIKIDRTYASFNYTYNAPGNNFLSAWGMITASLIKTTAGGVTGGGLTTGILAKQYIAEAPNYHVDLGMGSSNIVPVACSITTPALTFPIGDVLASSFGTAVGTIPAGAQNTQNLGLNCDAGANINVALTGTQNPDINTTSVLALSNQGNVDVAKGVGVQLLYNGTPMILNNQIVLKKSSGGLETFPLTARYYQTKSTVTTGKANATATLNITYQ
ncbi:fimbrial protein [Enterobacter roggenkampii]|uniref:fimbrial protein n=1 Tax=Enterobacter roggenkampii TaxID=1812935 RepID=UPI002A8108FA|nr:fimbrial protein [Enterobacter roggenkampii]